MTSADYMRSLLPVSTGLSAAEISKNIPQALRDASVFSARNVYVGHISDTQADIAKALEGGMSAAEVRGLMKLRLRKLGFAPSESDQGGLKDLSSDVRTSLVVSHQMQRAAGYAQWRANQDETVLDAFPGQEMYRAGAPKVPRDWQDRWNKARESLGPATSALEASSRNGPFFALKNDPIWIHPAVNRFGSPFPPFDYNSSMRVRNVGRRKCRELGLLKDDALSKDLLRPARDPMDGNVVSSSASGMDQELVKSWADSFGDRARVYAGRDGLPRVAVAPPADAIARVVEAASSGNAKATAAFGFPSRPALDEIGAAIGKPVRPEAPLQADADTVRHIIKSHGSEARAGQRPITADDIKAIPATLSGPGRWRASSDQEKAGYSGDAATFVADSGELVCFRITGGKNDPRLSLKTLYAQKEKDRPAD